MRRILFVNHYFLRRRQREFGRPHYLLSLKIRETSIIRQLDRSCLRLVLGVTVFYLYCRQNVAPAEGGLVAAGFTTYVRYVGLQVRAIFVFIFRFEFAPFD